MDPLRLSMSLSVNFRFELFSQALLSEAETTAVPRKSGTEYGQVDLSEKPTCSWQGHRLVNANPESLMMRVAIDTVTEVRKWEFGQLPRRRVVREAENQGSIILSAWWSNPWGRTYQSDCICCLLTCNPSCMFCVCVCADVFFVCVWKYGIISWLCFILSI